MESTDKKSHFRKIFKQHLEKIQNNRNIPILDARIQTQLKSHITCTIKLHKRKSHRPFKLLFYYPLPTEFNTKKLLRFYRTRKNIQVFLPKISLKNTYFNAIPYRLPLTKQKFGILEPSRSNLQCSAFDCAVIPTIGIDGAFRRIGFGKGMYDRFLQTHKIQNIIFISRALNLTQEIITESYDVRGDSYITPFKTIHFKPCFKKCFIKQ